MTTIVRAAEAAPFTLARLAPFGVEVNLDLSRPLSPEDQRAFRDLFYREKLLVFRGQNLSEDDQVRVMSYIGGVLGSRGEYREISSDGNLGGGALCFHSDLSFTPEPFKALSLQALEVNDDETWTAFASGTLALAALDPGLRRRLEGLEALAVISATQSHRAAPYDPPAFLPQIARPAVIAHPVTGEPILYVTEMQTARLGGLSQPESDALLQQLFDRLYAPENLYRHSWRNGDLVIWDNLALQHARPDLTGVKPRRLQRIAVADKSFFDLCPQFSLDDPRVAAWGAGETLDV